VNRIAGTHSGGAIVADESGITRDRTYRRAEFLGEVKSNVVSLSRTRIIVVSFPTLLTMHVSNLIFTLYRLYIIYSELSSVRHRWSCF